MKKMIFGGIGILTALMLSAADVDLTQKENWTFANITKGSEVKFTKGKDGSLSLDTNSKICYLTRNIRYEKGKSWRIEGKVESNCPYFIKFYFIDSQGKLVNENQFHIVPETNTELTEATLGNETVIKVKDASKWKTGHSIAVGDRLPNQYTYWKQINSINKKDGYWEVQLKQPWEGKYGAGVKVRQMFNNDGILLANLHRLPVEAVELSHPMQDEFTSIGEKNKWWPNAVSISMQVIMHGKIENKNIKFTNLKIKEINTDW